MVVEDEVVIVAEAEVVRCGGGNSVGGRGGGGCGGC